MTYEFGHRKNALKQRAQLGAALLAAFAVGSAVTAAVCLRFENPLQLIGFGDTTEALDENSGRRSPTLAANSVLASLTDGTSTAAEQAAAQSAQGVRLAGCDDGSPRSFEGVSSPQLAKLAEYEQVCPGAVQGASFFIGTPATTQQAQGQAAWVADVLQQFAAKGIVPLIFMEPASDGNLLDATQYRNGAYDVSLDAFFAALKSHGISDSMMGTWVPWPESNIPVWTSVDPSDFAANVTKTVQIQKKHFPASKAAVLLESKTYPNAGSWSDGSYSSLVPFVESIPKGLIDSFGLQGFAWPPTAPNEAPMLEPKTFLRTDLAAQAAQALGVQEVWFNTGVYSSSSVAAKPSPDTLTPKQRQEVLDGILARAKVLKGQGFAVNVHLFAQDKSSLGEAIDWSFWKPGQQATSASTLVLKTFFGDLEQNGIGIWLYDAGSN